MQSSRFLLHDWVEKFLLTIQPRRAGKKQQKTGRIHFHNQILFCSFSNISSLNVRMCWVCQLRLELHFFLLNTLNFFKKHFFPLFNRLRFTQTMKRGIITWWHIFQSPHLVNSLLRGCFHLKTFFSDGEHFNDDVSNVLIKKDSSNIAASNAKLNGACCIKTNTRIRDETVIPFACLFDQMTVGTKKKTWKKRWNFFSGPMRKHVLLTFNVSGFLFLSLIKNSRTVSFRLHLPQERQ